MKRAATTLAVSLGIALVAAACAALHVGRRPDLVARGLRLRAAPRS
jgi:hypothetical protein